MKLSLLAWRASFFATLGITLAACGDDLTTTSTAGSDSSSSDSTSAGTSAGSQTSDASASSDPSATGSGSASTTSVSTSDASSSGTTEGATSGPTTTGSTGTTAPTTTGSTGTTDGGSDSGGTSTGTTDAATSTSGTDTGEPLCEGAVDVLQWNGMPSGFIECPNGAILRAEQIECSIEPANDQECPWAGSCTLDSECDAMPGGQCVVDPFFGQCGCVYPQCTTDEDCGAGQVCDCGVLGDVPQCIPADCYTNDECDGFGCRLYDAMPDCYSMTLSCHGPDDACYADSECPLDQTCLVVGDTFQCSPPNCAIGRPFLVAGRARVAGDAGRDDWRARDVQPDCTGFTGVDDPRRVELRAHWSHTARMEHASVAAFARFALQLLALGAPADLVSETRRAMQDETRHARLAYALASAYGRRELGPGPLAITGALADDTLAAIVEMVILEGCVGETVAAVEAAELHEHVRDPALTRVYATIAADERRHAALAWRFLSWALDRAHARTRAQIDACARRLEREVAGARPRLAADDRLALRRGVTTDAARRHLRSRVLTDVVLPGLRALTLQRAA